MGKSLVKKLLTAGALLACTAANAGHFYGQSGDPAVDVIYASMTNGTLTGFLPASAPQPNEDFLHVVLFANAGDVLTVDTNGSDADTGLAINFDVLLDGIFVGDVPLTDLALTFSNDDGGIGLDSLISFTATYTGAYLVSIAEISGGALNWQLNISGSTFSVPAPMPIGLALMGLLMIAGKRRLKSASTR